MSGILKSSHKHSESAINQSGASMHFWGVCCESGKQYAQVVGQRFRITMAVLDPKSFEKDVSERTVSLIVIRGGIEYLLCVLKHGEIHQVNLNLIFDKGENVKFYINGHGKVYLSGYQLTDSEGDVLNDESGYLCPLVEVKTKGKKANVDKIPRNPVKSEELTPKSKKKLKTDKVTSEESSSGSFWNAFVNQNKSDDDDDDDESDEDFSIGEEETESDDEDNTSEEVEEEEEEEELDDDVEDEKEINQNSQGSQKRKHEKILRPQKRPRNESFNNTSKSSENSEDIICIEDNESESEESSDNMNSSIGNTPMPKRQMNNEAASSEKKRKKKKKRLSEISNISEKSVNIQNKEQQLKSPTAKSTPRKTKGEKYPIQKIEGGVEIQDVVVGRGPTAVTGKMVHVFYVGRFQDKTIFDSRLPGKKPFSFKLGAQQVIKGWDIGLQGMKVGGKRKLKVPPNMGYGNSAIEGIPPNSTLFFVIELQAVS